MFVCYYTGIIVDEIGHTYHCKSYGSRNSTRTDGLYNASKSKTYVQPSVRKLGQLFLFEKQIFYTYDLHIQGVVHKYLHVAVRPSTVHTTELFFQIRLKIFNYDFTYEKKKTTNYFMIMFSVFILFLMFSIFYDMVYKIKTHVFSTREFVLLDR